jgi:hypothetical protein
MAYRELRMIEVREVPRRFKYIAACVAAGLCPGCALPTDAQVAAIIAAIRPPHIGRPRRSLSG